MELSKRLYAVAGLVTEGASVADIGTDHGYIPIYLTEHNIASKVIAADIRKGPLERARMHIISRGLKGRIETRLSDGLKAVRPGEVDTVIASGMGGDLVIKILEEGSQVVASLHACILQPQSEIQKVRRYLVKHGMRIEAEDMVEEDGKFYPVMRAVHGEPEPYTEVEYLYGKYLLRAHHPVLKKYLYREMQIKESIFHQLYRHRDSKSAALRMEEVRREMQMISRAFACYTVNPQGIP